MGLMGMYPKTRWTLIGTEVGDLKPVIHLGTVNFNDEPFRGGRRGISICGKRITTTIQFENDALVRCLQCRMIITEYMDEPATISDEEGR